MVRESTRNSAVVARTTAPRNPGAGTAEPFELLACGVVGDASREVDIAVLALDDDTGRGAAAFPAASHDQAAPSRRPEGH